MEAILRQLNCVPGVVGSCICTEDGKITARDIPPRFDDATLLNAAGILSDSILDVDDVSGHFDLLDLRYGDGRIVVKTAHRYFLMLVCARTVNLQLLTLSLNVAAKKVGKAIAAAPAGTAQQGNDTLPATTAIPTGPVQIRTTGKGVLLQASLLKSTANTYWDHMLDTVAINRRTALEISNFFHAGSFKKIKLTHQASGNSKVFKVRIIADDKDHLFDGITIISLAIAESLHAREGDLLLSELTIGGGIFGWEGI